ncbi:MAG: N-acetylmuramoyl-L-alanine amidase [Gammaproteobacteria bacterium]
MRLLGIILAACLAQSVLAEPVKVNNVRIWAAPDSTRVVFDISAPVEHDVTMLTDPFRAVIDLENTDFKADNVAEPEGKDRYLQGVRTGVHQKDLRVVLDLKKFARTRIFQLPPNAHYGHRLVVDLSDREEQEAEPEIVREERKSQEPRDVVIAVDAGHGGEDPGALGPSGTYEKNVVYKLARKLVDMINKERGMRAVMIREGDYYLGLRQRIQKARRHRADLFISLHADAFRDPRVHGSSVYVLSQGGASSEHARWLAERENASDLIGGVNLDSKDNVLASVLLDLSQTASLEASIDVADRVLQGLGRVGKLHKRQVESAGFAVLKSPDIPSVLVETAYISNPDEERNLRSEHHQRKLAGAILDGLRTYFWERPPEGTLLAERGTQRKYVISRGDTLSGIAQRYRVSLQRLRHMNSLDSDTIRVGQVLAIPADG